MNFLKDNKRFSFKIGGVNAWDTDFDVHVKEKDNEVICEYCFKNGIKVTNIAKKYEEFNGYEWVNYIENTASENSLEISELWDCDCSFPIPYEEPQSYTAYKPDVEKATKIFAPKGSYWAKDEFYADADKMVEQKRINHIYPGMKKEYMAKGGRSSDTYAPFFNVHKEGKGYIFAIGWTGRWQCEIERGDEDITFRSKIQDTQFYLLPGEKIRTSSIVVMAYESDVTDAHNKWRRFVKKHFSLIGSEGRDEFGPLCAGIWGGMTTKSVLDRVEKIKKYNLPYEYVWMDAGWYGDDENESPDEFEGKWFSHTGDWKVNKFVHPDGLKDVTKAVHDAGMKFLLWFEPERAINTTEIVQNHPEYFLKPENPDERSYILDLGNEDAWNYCFDTLSGLIDELKIDCYRQDFNFEPITYWRKNDAPGRKGISEIKHINGMYKLWDALLEKFPGLIIDNCASGGRRIDIETLRRSMPMWRSDYQCSANYDVISVQCHSMNYNLWMPYSGSGTGRIYDEYRVRSAYESSISVSYSFPEREAFCEDEEKIEFLKKYTAEYLKVRPYFCEDFYALTEFSESEDTWCVMQFDRPSENDGIIRVFRREKSPYETGTFNMRGVDENKNYVFSDIDGGEFTVTGKELKEKGLSLTMPEKRTAKIYIYKSI